MMLSCMALGKPYDCPQYSHRPTYMNESVQNEICPWVDDTIELLNKLPRKIKMVEVASASGVPVVWLSRFNAGKFKNPNIFYVYRLYQYLTAQ